MPAAVTGGARGKNEYIVYACAEESVSIVLVGKNVDGAGSVCTNVEKKG